MALDAARGRIRWMVLREVLLLCAAGLTIGIVAAWNTASTLQSFVFGLKPADPLTMLLAAAILVAASVSAGLAPALRASQIEPAIALRHE